MCVGNKRGPRDSIRLLIVTNAHESCFTTLINNLSVKHTIGQQMILFHRFLDWTDELFIDVLPLVQEKVGWGCWKGKKKQNKEISKQIVHNLYTQLISLPIVFLTYISSSLSTSAGSGPAPVKRTKFFFCQCCWITQTLLLHALSPDAEDNVTVKFKRKMVTGIKNFTVCICQCFLLRSIVLCKSLWGQHFISVSLLRLGFYV